MIETFTIVGGASAYAPGLFAALLHHAERLDLQEVRLYDIAPQRLETVGHLCKAMAADRDAPFEVVTTTDRREAVRETDALLNSTRPGGFECRQVDETLPLEFGIPGQETVGPGGFFFALRSIPAADALAEDVREVAPDAIWLNYTNPTNIVGQMLCDSTDLNVLALCDQSDEDFEAMLHALGGDKLDYSFECVGLNHASWYSDIELGGEPLDDRILQVDAPEYYDDEHKERFRLSQRLAYEHSVTDGDGNVERWRWPNSYLPYYYDPTRFVELSRRVGPRTEAILEKLDEYYEHFEEEADRDAPDLQKHRGSEGFGDMAVDVLAALGAEDPSSLILNIPNRGMSSEFDDDTLIEARVGLSEDGVERRPVPKLRGDERPLLEQLEVYQRRTSEAALSGRPTDAVAALASNPLVDGRETAETMLRQAEEMYPKGSIPLFSS